MPKPDLPRFLAMLRSRDADEVAQLLSQYEPIIRQAIHLRLLSGRLQHLVETADIFQSLVLDFLTQQPRAATGPGDLHAYLARAVRNKVLARLRKEHRRAGEVKETYDRVSPGPSAEWLVEARDTLRAIRDRLPMQERHLLDLLGQGFSWPAIAAQVGGSPDALRMRLNRAIASIRTQMEQGEAHYVR